MASARPEVGYDTITHEEAGHELTPAEMKWKLYHAAACLETIDQGWYVLRPTCFMADDAGQGLNELNRLQRKTPRFEMSEDASRGGWSEELRTSE